MNVGLDQAGAGEPPRRVVALAGFPQRSADRRDAVALDTDVDGLPVRPIGEPNIAHDQVHWRPFSGELLVEDSPVSTWGRHLTLASPPPGAKRIKRRAAPSRSLWRERG